MWVKLMTVQNAYVAEMWRGLFYAEALAVRIVPVTGSGNASELGPHDIYVPWGKLHVAQEIIRKI